MKNTLHLRLFTIFLPLVCATTTMAQTIQPSGSWIRPSDLHIQYVGRVSFNNPDSPCFTYPGVQINSGFTGTSLKMVAKPMSGYFMVQIDQAEPFKVSFNAPNDSIVTLATALSDTLHQVRLMYAIEGYQRRPEFRGFIVDEGKTLSNAPELPSRRIEFIGNSITCGFGNESINPANPFMDETENHYYTYAARTARALKAQHLVVARSGIGVYRNYNGPVTGNADNMPAMYTQTLFTDTTQTWDFSRYTPDVVCVNLGTNDTSTTPYDTHLLEKAYVQFIQQLRGYYPHAKIVLLSGVILNGQALADVKNAMNHAVTILKQKGDQQLYRFDMTPQDGSLGIGACGHPSIRQHEKMSRELTAYLQRLMAW